MTYAWGDPDPVQSQSWDDFANETVLWIQGGVHPAWTTQYGTKPAPRGTLVVLSGRNAGEVVEDRLILNGKHASTVKDKPAGFYMVARLVKVDKSFVFESAGDYGRHVANQWAAANPGQLEQLVAAAMRNYAEAAARGQQPAKDAPAPAPQYVPPQAQPVQYATQYPPAAPPAQAPPQQYAPPAQAPVAPSAPPPQTYGPPAGNGAPQPPTGFPMGQPGAPAQPAPSPTLDSMSAPAPAPGNADGAPF